MTGIQKIAFCQKNDIHLDTFPNEFA